MFDAEQAAEINRLIEEKKGEYAASATAAVSAAIIDGRVALMSKVDTAVKEAISANQSIVLATVQSAKSENPKGRLFEWAKILVPVIVTALLGVLVWRWQHAAEDRSRVKQSELEAKIDQNAEFLKAKLALNQEYFKRKMDALQEIWKQMALVYADANTAYQNPNEMTKALNSLGKLSESLEASKLYLGDDTYAALNDFWAAARDLTLKQIKPAKLEEKRATAKAKVYHELGLSEINTLSNPSLSR